MFAKIWYDDISVTHGPEQLNLDKLKNTIVKVIVTNKTDPYRFDLFVNKLEKVGLLDMQIVEDHMNLAVEEDSDIINEAESTLNIFKRYIDQVNSVNLDKVKLEQTIVDLYQEALTVE
jgi:hypothetical protein